MRVWNTRTFQSKLLIVLCLLCILPTISLGWLAYQKSVDSLERKVIEDLKVIIGQFDNTLATQVEGLDRFSTLPYATEELIDIAASPSAPTEQWDLAELNKQQRLIELISSYPSVNRMIEAMLFYGVNGSIYGYRVSGFKSIDKSGSPSEEQWFKDAVQKNGALVISGLRSETQFSDEPFETITIARMLVDRKYAPAAVIAVDVKPDFIAKTVQSLGFQNVHVTVAGPYGEVYTTNPAISKELLNKDNDLNRDTIRPLPVTIDTRINGETEKWSGVKKYNDYTGWTTYLLVDRKELLKESAVIKDYSVFVVVLICVATAILSWLLARGLSKPIRGLIRSMQAVEKGLFVLPATPVDARKDEFGQLLLRYNRMVVRLEEMVNSISQSERLKREAELNALRARINPHFLHNTINSIRMLAILQDSDQIADLLRAFSQLLNSNMKLDQELITIREEIVFLKDYLQLMELRYTEKFSVEWRIQDETRNALIPAMILQPIVENAIFHGAAGINDRVHIIISAEVSADGSQLQLCIADDGIGMDAAKVAKLNADKYGTDNRNIGIGNVRDRIGFRFGRQYGLSIESQVGQGVKVKLSMPFIGGDKFVEDDGRRG